MTHFCPFWRKGLKCVIKCVSKLLEQGVPVGLCWRKDNKKVHQIGAFDGLIGLL